MSTDVGMKKRDLWKWAACVALAVVPFLVPAQGAYTPACQAFIAITACGLALCAFEIVPLLFVAIVMPGCWILFGVAPASTVMSPWLGTTFPMVIGALFMAASLEQSGLLRRVAFSLMKRVRGNWLLILVAIFLSSVLINVLTSGRAYIIMGALAAGLVASLGGMQKKTGAGIAMAVMIGGCTSHSYTFMATSWAVLGGVGGESLSAITPLSIMLHNWPLAVVSLAIIWVMSRMFKPESDFGDITYFADELEKMGKITRRERANAIMLLMVLAYIFTVDLHHQDLNLGFIIIPFFVYLPFIDGADRDTVKRVNFPIIFFIAACMGIGSVASSLGLGDAILAFCQMLLNGQTNPFAIVLLIFAIVFVLNFLMTPLAIFSLITAPVLAMVTSMGYDPVPFAYTINACTEAIIFPYEYVLYLIVYGFGMISMRDFIVANIVRSAMFFVGFLVILVPYWMLIGLL